MKKSLFTYRGFTGSVGVSVADNCLYGKILFINDLVNYRADSPVELEKEFKDAVDDYLETCKEYGLEPNKPFSGTFNVRIGSDLHKQVALLAFEEDLKINQVVKNALHDYVRSKIVDTVHHSHIHKYIIEYESTIDLSIQEKSECQLPLRVVN
jgi:predicted HicB family RNase H-like nuclease